MDDIIKAIIIKSYRECTRIENITQIYQDYDKGQAKAKGYKSTLTLQGARSEVYGVILELWNSENNNKR